MTQQLSLDDPMLIAHNGRLAWQYPCGRILPVVRGGAEGDPEPKTFTQADLDRIVADRLARAKADPPADYEELKAAKVELDRLKADADAAAAKNLTEAEATTKRILALEESVTKSNQAMEAAKAEALAEKKRSAIVAAAATQKAANPDQVAALVELQHKDAVTIGDDGQVTGAEKAVKDFIEANPHFVGSPSRPKPDPAQGRTGDAKDFGAAGLAEARKRFGTPVAAQQQQ